MKNIIITGAANGVGKAVANILKDNNLILIDEDLESLKNVSEELNANFYSCNLADEKEIVRQTKEDNFYQILTIYETINQLQKTLRHEKVYNTDENSLLKNDK